MSPAALITVAGLLGGLAFILGRRVADVKKTVLRLAFASASGALGGLSFGVLAACLLSPYVGMQPGSTQNLWTLNVCLGLLGLMLGSIGGIAWGHKITANQ